jgi:Predicted membrane protein (DUF2079)
MVPASDTAVGSVEPASLRAWLAIAVLTGVVTVISAYQSLRQYDSFQCGWSWDLAYYNQWYWALTRGDRTVTVRPVSGYAEEGPSVWKMNYLAPIRLMLVPIYSAFPGPRTLLLIQSVMFWWVIPAAFTLVRSESRRESVALAGAALVPLTPYFWPMAVNDFRELQLAGGFVLWAVQGVRSRSRGVAALGIVGSLACRQEFALMVATLAFLPPRQPEPLRKTLNWRRSLFLIGIVWLFAGFFGYLRMMVSKAAADAFIDQFLVPSAPALETLRTAVESILVGMGAWGILACLAPRAAILTVPWVWGVCNGRWATSLLATTQWHEVRYFAPAAFLILACGLIGYARLAQWLLNRPAARWWLRLVWLAAAGSCAGGLYAIVGHWAAVPPPIDRAEAGAVWRWIEQVGPRDVVVADYEVAAPLSSRPKLYSYILEFNLPDRSHRLGPEIGWLFIRNSYGFRNYMLEQNFEIVHQGQWLTIGRRVLTVTR